MSFFPSIISNHLYFPVDFHESYTTIGVKFTDPIWIYVNIYIELNSGLIEQECFFECWGKIQYKIFHLLNIIGIFILMWQH